MRDFPAFLRKSRNVPTSRNQRRKRERNQLLPVVVRRNRHRSKFFFFFVCSNLIKGHLSIFAYHLGFIVSYKLSPAICVLLRQAPIGFIGLAALTLAGPKEESISSYSPLGWGLLLALAQTQGTRNLGFMSHSKDGAIEVKQLAQGCKQTCQCRESTPRPLDCESKTLTT